MGDDQCLPSGVAAMPLRLNAPLVSAAGPLSASVLAVPAPRPG